MVSLLGHLFSGKKALFDNLYIGKHTDYVFEEYPVLKFNFAAFGHQVKNLEAILEREILKYAQQFHSRC
ncbi:MAG: AAA family ATPase [Saprospiraceae bacterium]|nr:AAA family ATPase [Saprospiraceae bacterium]